MYALLILDYPRSLFEHEVWNLYNISKKYF